MASVTTTAAPRNTEPGVPPDAKEGLDWLGRAPSARSNLLYRVLWSIGRLGLWVCGIRPRVEGLEHRPASGGYITACAAHRSWVDGPLMYLVFPREPRIWYLANGLATIRRAWMNVLMHAMGGMLPVYRGGTDVSVHMESAQAVLDAGAIFALFPEGTRAGTPLELSRFRRGVGLIGLRTSVPIVPVVVAGTWELYRGRRVAVRVLPPVDALSLAGLSSAPEAGSAAELQAAKQATEALRALLAPHYAECAAWAADPPSVRRRWRWLSGAFR
jgi:1-acyl-sn-glycerol-3-phosphate acyltransferase